MNHERVKSKCFLSIERNESYDACFKPMAHITIAYLVANSFLRVTTRQLVAVAKGIWARAEYMVVDVQRNNKRLLALDSFLLILYIFVALHFQ